MTLTSSSSGAQRRGPGRPPAADAATIGAAVVDVGFSALTFAAVSAHLGVGQATLYRHAPTRDDLVRLGLDHALRSAEWPGLDGEWRPLLERWAVASWRLWEQHPGAVLDVARGIVPRAVVTISDRLGAALVAQGFTPRAAVLAVDLVFDLTADSRRGVETLDAPGAEPRGDMRTRIEDQWREPGARGGADLVHAEMIRAITADPFEWFHGKLRVVLAGIAQELAPADGAAPHPSEAPKTGPSA